MPINTLGASPLIFRKRLQDQPNPPARGGDLIALVGQENETLGFGYFNPKSEVSVRVLRGGETPPDELFWDELLNGACGFAARHSQTG